MSVYRAQSGSEGRTVTVCPYCRSTTHVPRQRRCELGTVSLDEVEALVRNEWRRRLGRSAYPRPHPRRFIRALIVFALQPESPVRSASVNRLLWDEVAALQVWGLSRTAIQRELATLLVAAGHVLGRTQVGPLKATALLERIDRKLRETLEWPEPLGAQGAAGEGDGLGG